MRKIGSRHKNNEHSEYDPLNRRSLNYKVYEPQYSEDQLNQGKFPKSQVNSRQFKISDRNVKEAQLRLFSPGRQYIP